METTYRIKFDQQRKNATVEQPSGVLKKDQDTVRFTFEGAEGVQPAIRFRATSPFAEGKLGPNQVFPLGRSGEGPFLCVNLSPQIGKVHHHFDCGLIVQGVFVSWEGTGADVPVGP